jgi:hypothetical protein
LCRLKEEEEEVERRLLSYDEDDDEAPPPPPPRPTIGSTLTRLDRIDLAMQTAAGTVNTNLLRK